jgi:hypothetical protein
VRHYPNGTYAIFHGPRCIGRYDAEGMLSGEFAPPVRQADLSTASPRARGPSTTLRAAKGDDLARATSSLTALSRKAVDIDRSAPGNGADGLTRKSRWRHRSANR